LLELLTERRSGQQASYLFFFAAVHDLLLSGAPHPLREFLPVSCRRRGHAPPADAGPVLIDFLPPSTTTPSRPLVRTRLVQSNVVRRVIGLRFAFVGHREELSAGPCI